ncbi:aminoglycoside phosphotransferase family protein [Saccharopolyspora erythraea]|uniref:aminoglycoside phosphotransferase family protein n=1 Tax=Saccharopolyspora erythraea TaxID=1836 RepID=UPI001BA64837|nr:aminoglycoside phosphotransferase family protein [Saccharopolyspora erythraea]QUH05017.1 aminoglycoside phosphotransferase family protein [Saccharopolyspora erythraea]
MAIPELTGQDVAAGVGELLPEAAPIRPLRPLRQGRSHASWVLESSRGRLVGKVFLGRLGAGGLARLAEHRRVCEQGIPVPAVLAFTASCAAVAGRPLTVFKYLPGRDAEEALPSLESETVLEVMRDTGAALARLHQVPVEGFGDPLAGREATSASWNDVVVGRAEALLSAYRSVDGVPAALIKAGLELLCELAEKVSPVVWPAVTHLDVYLPNILLDEQGSFRALLDLEHVRWGDPVMDFVKPAMWMFADQPEWAEAFIDGYRASNRWPAAWSERLAVATGLELLTGVEYWVRVADHAMRENYLRRLRAWVQSDGVDHVWSAISRTTRLA